MTRKDNDEQHEKVRAYYRRLMEQYRAHMDLQDERLPPARVDFQDAMKTSGVSRRGFHKWAAALMLPPTPTPRTRGASPTPRGSRPSTFRADRPAHRTS